LKKVAITGGLSCGKSSVCQLFKSLGAYVMSADEIVHQLLSPDTKYGKKIINLLGQSILNEEKQFDRAKIAQIVFSQPQLLRQLEEILHPAVKAEIAHQYHQIKDSSVYKMFVVEVPLLFEADMAGFFDSVVVVAADEAIAKSRYSALPDGDMTSYELRKERLWPLAKKIERADYVIENNGTERQLTSKSQELFSQLIR